MKAGFSSVVLASAFAVGSAAAARNCSGLAHVVPKLLPNLEVYVSQSYPGNLFPLLAFGSTVADS